MVTGTPALFDVLGMAPSAAEDCGDLPDSLPPSCETVGSCPDPGFWRLLRRGSNRVRQNVIALKILLVIGVSESIYLVDQIMDSP